jgi:transcriptional regulator with XRE-family HTH domain
VSSQAQQAREALGARLREIRKDAGLTGRALAALAGWQLSKVSRIEHGRRAISEDDLRTWCQHCRTRDQLPELIATVRNIEAMWLEWRRTLATGTRIRQQHSISLYEQTKIFRIYQPNLVWGTLQTAEYAAAMLRQVTDFYDIPDDVDRGVAARLQRQQYLYKGDRRYNVILGEQALYTCLDTAEVQRGQLDRLLAIVSLPRLSLGIIPIRARYHLWPSNGFIMFDERAVMVETYSAELTITQPREIALYSKAFDTLHRSAAYGLAARELITRALQQFTSAE